MEIMKEKCWPVKTMTPVLVPTVLCIILLLPIMVFLVSAYVGSEIPLILFLLCFLIAVLMVVSGFRILIVSFRAISIHSEGITLSAPFSKERCYRWDSIYRIDLAEVFIGRSSYRIFRCFLKKPRSPWGSKRCSIEACWFSRDPVIVLLFTQERLKTIECYKNISFLMAKNKLIY